MKRKVAVSFWLLALLLLAVAPVAAAEGDPVYLPGWVAWIMVAVALGVPVGLFFYLRNRGRL